MFVDLSNRLVSCFVFDIQKKQSESSSTGQGRDDDDDDMKINQIVINGLEADCKENIEIKISKITTANSNEAAEQWMSIYQDVLSSISDTLKNKEWSKLYSLFDDDGNPMKDIETMEDLKDAVENHDGRPIHFTLKSVEY